MVLDDTCTNTKVKIYHVLTASSLDFISTTFHAVSINFNEIEQQFKYLINRFIMTLIERGCSIYGS